MIGEALLFIGRNGDFFSHKVLFRCKLQTAKGALKAEQLLGLLAMGLVRYFAPTGLVLCLLLGLRLLALERGRLRCLRGLLVGLLHARCECSPRGIWWGCLPENIAQNTIQNSRQPTVFRLKWWQ